MKHNSRIWLVGCGLGLLLLAACQGKESGATSTSLEKRSLPSGTAGSVIEQLAANLKSAGYTDILVANVMDYATAQVAADGTEGSTDTGAILASVQTGAAAALALSSSDLSTDTEKTTAIGVISGSLAAMLGSSSSKVSQLSGAQKSVTAPVPAYAYSVTVDASSDYSSYLESLMTATIGTMDEAGISASAIESKSSSLVETVMTKLSTNSLSSEFLAAALGGITAGAIAGIDDGGVGSANAASVSETLLSSVMGKVSSFGLSATYLESAMESVAAKAVSALGKSGVSSASASAAAQSLMQTMVTKLTTAGVSTTNLSTVMQKVSEQGVANLGNAGVPSADRTTAVENMVSAISAKVKSAGVSDADLSTVMAAIAQGAVSGTGSLGFSAADKQTAIAGASSGALAGLKTAGYSTTQISNVSGSVTTGATKGLSKAGVSSGDQSTYAAKIQTGAEAGLSKGGLSSAEVSALSATLQTAINSGLSTIGSNTLPGTSTSTSTSTTPPNPKALTAFSFTRINNPSLANDITATITGTSVTFPVPYGTTLTSLIPTFTHNGSYVTFGGAVQSSGVTAQNFTSPLIYQVTATDGTSQNFTVTATIGAASANKAITAFSFTSVANGGLSSNVTGTISGSSIALTVPYGTILTSLKPTFTHTGVSVGVNGTTQTSGVTAQDFTIPVTYQVYAQDGTRQNFLVTVTVASNTAKEITAFSFTKAANGAFLIDVTGIISGTNITATVPYGTTLTALKATFSTTGASVSIGGTAQTSGTTANNFTSAVTYRVTAADGSTQDYTVTVSTAAPSTTKAITAFSFTTALNGGAGIPVNVTGTINSTNIDLTVPAGTTVTALKPTFTTTGASVSISGAPQTSGVTAQNYSSPVTYRVTAQDGSTQDYTVTVTVPLSTAKAITAFSFNGPLNLNASLGSNYTGVISGTTITIYGSDTNQPYLTGVQSASLVASFTAPLASVKVGGVTQVSGTTANDFTTDLSYLVTAEDGSTQTYSVVVKKRWVLPDTGQTSCWDGAGNPITCPAAGNALAQDGSYNTTAQPSYTDNGNGTVNDNVTGRVWQQCSAGTSTAACATGTAGAYTWADAGTYCANNTAGLSGSGWRLPTKTELSWIVMNQGGSTLFNTAFPATVTNSYWTSTTYMDATYAWNVFFGHGRVDVSSKTSVFYVRCVR